MTTLTLKHKATPGSDWKTEVYHGQQMHVCTTRRAVDNAALSGPGHQWDFLVNVTAGDAGPSAQVWAHARSDPDLFYSTQAIAEDMGFLRGRELIEGS